MRERKLFSREAAAIFTNGMLYRNPMLIGALGMYPIVAAGYSLRNALELTLLFVLVSVPTNLLLCLLGMLVPRWFRPGLVLLVSAAVYVPAAWLTDRAFPGSIAGLGMAAGLMICNSAIFSRSEEYAPEHIALAVASDTVGTAVGFALVVCLIAAARELFVSGALELDRKEFPRGGATLPFAGFLLLGFLAALVQWMNSRRNQKTSDTGGRRG